MERRQDVSVLRLHDVLLEQRDEVSRGRNNNVLSVRHHDISVVRIHDVSLKYLYNVSCKSKMKHPITLLWYVSTTSLNYVVATPCW